MGRPTPNGLSHGSSYWSSGELIHGLTCGMGRPTGVGRSMARHEGVICVVVVASAVLIYSCCFDPFRRGC